MNFRCECGQRIHDTTDYLSYKGYLISDQDQFDLLDEIDDAIEKSGPSSTDKEEAAMRIRSLISTLFKTVYQCSNCGNFFIDNNHPSLEMFRGANQVNKNLLVSALGDKWRGFIYAEWKDKIPDWQTSNGTLFNETNSSSLTGKLDGNGEYGDWETLEQDYYQLFNELKNKNVIRYSQLKKNYTVIHSWSLQK
ncbi:hypothetical protein LMZ02_11105 [Paenibacillus macerans]|uniref:hypothetical protein n=1 Tax=Paenibacillus macerans TaxID=44252 RepID=UPI0012D8BEA8|nr:hypothetical protein [Paenibacillus macerans]UMV49858.1 hypothetical protein LMZ02_11105 [Paenibacillus macerans]